MKCLSDLFCSYCKGLTITSYRKAKPNRIFEQRMSSSINAYKKYKSFFKMLNEFEGDSWESLLSRIKKLQSHTISFVFVDYELKLDLKFVRIYFDTTTFDVITKDRAAKFVDMLSAIGGTMGLLTGFSIISGVEIVYFGVKIMPKLLQKWLAVKRASQFHLSFNNYHPRTSFKSSWN